MGFVSNVLIFLINSILFVAGAVVLTIGILELTDSGVIDYFTSLLFGQNHLHLSSIIDVNQLAEGSSIFLICIGSVVIVLTVIGFSTICCSGCKILAITYGVYLFLLMLVELAAIVYLSIPIARNNFQNTLNSMLKSSLEQTFTPMTFSSSDLINEQSVSTWSAIQLQYSCCGVASYHDYASFTWDKNITVNGATYTSIVPPSCCQQVDQSVTPTTSYSFSNITACLTAAPSFANIKGCSDYLMYSISQFSNVSAIACAVLIVLQVICFGLAVDLCGKESKGNQVGVWG